MSDPNTWNIRVSFRINMPWHYVLAANNLRAFCYIYVVRRRDFIYKRNANVLNRLICFALNKRLLTIAFLPC